MSQKAKSPQKRVQVKDLPKKEKKLTAKEQKKVQGGTTGDGKLLGNLLTDKIIGGAAGSGGPYVKGS